MYQTRIISHVDIRTLQECYKNYHVYCVFDLDPLFNNKFVVACFILLTKL